MLRLPPFRFLRPTTARDAARILADWGGGAMVVAGGTDLYPNMKRRQFEPKALVSVRSIAGLDGVEANGAL
ncbi:MAG TPA: FAD binding domain-containing protein, partial [Methylomirabilota bacterium]|nr:FAD binding domain-containing protein [Methylomirabilota bacterium]